ncbi:TRAP transporter large permease [Fusobacterium necrophorum]|uniref:Sialic acid TRAP transporter, permease protein SiaT n=2 Tax=Fusobacterium necrophorum TaxID=859 RepID=A0AAN3VXI6_9FUSO|nr:TRAP transporter large permease subunit [Fusobacterium necrophorum]AYV95451.1 TRAP transporter large permease subunit [Fusobacterium necrophorum subsp. funduliforme]EFS23066.1 sialic acid TRAP transporter permease protein SiaT [Fusobacterium necrophorum D12]EJU18884.1 sialic acid TRAP transporter, permease protein SiaT [Fusobacterium necrophorum subsp. funduliforme Fnf 1007]KYL02211.1 C4-dicarboxylate ABC transporter permease [Fusobacterium necrophorum subsp. funduliforme]KYL03661.1 C4-dica
MKFFNKLEEWIGGTLFVGMFIVLVLQIISRQILDDPLIWSEELARLFFVYVGMLGISMGIRTQSHVMIDFVYARLPKKLQKVIFTGIQIIIFLCITSFSYFGYLLIEKKADIELVSLGISAKWMYIALPVISILMLIRFFQAYQENWEKEKVLISPKIILGFMILFMALLIFQPSVFKIFKMTQYFKLRGNSVYVALVLWLILIFAGVPVGWSLLASSMAYFSMTKWAVAYFASSKFVDSVDSFSLLSVPFFILTGILMNGSGITERIFYFAKASLGHYTGGMGHVNVAASLIFSGMSGSAIADAGGLGQLEIKAMRDEGYDDDICGGITAASCIIGPLVPPSISMIIYGVIANQSIAKLFLAGFVPGVLTTIALMIMNYFVCKKRGYKKAKKCTRKERWEAFKKAFWALLTPIIIIGGIFSGMFTPTEAAVVAALYSVILGMFIYKELTWKGLFQHCVEAMAISGVTVLMIITVTFFGDMIAREQVAMKIAELFIQFASSPLTVLVMINLLLLFLGMFIDALALQFLVLPMLIPVAEQVGIDLVFFGVMTTLNMMIGILTPPMGMALFVVAQVGKMPVSTVTKGVLPFLLPIFITLVVITLFPQIIIFLPNLIMGA